MRIAVITGASSGIGREFVRQIPKCYKRLDEIWLVARSTDKLKKIKEETEGISYQPACLFFFENGEERFGNCIVMGTRCP